MNRWNIIPLTFFGLMLASMVLPAGNAFASTPGTPTCSSGTLQAGTCNCNASSTVYSIPVTLSDSVQRKTLPFNDVVSGSHGTLPATSVAGVSSSAAGCTNGCTCSGGACPTKDDCGYCGGGVTCSGSCTNASGCSCNLYLLQRQLHLSRYSNQGCLRLLQWRRRKL